MNDLSSVTRRVTHFLLFRDFSAAVQTTAIAGTKRKREIAKQANEIAAQMEAKDTAIQRIQRQLEAVRYLSCIDAGNT